TPKHGSWLNMAEIELSVFSRQCLGRRIGDEAMLLREVAALERQRNEAQATIAWRFTAPAARATLHHLYPTHQNHVD
ncbi:MAG: IS630 family transposase, partial [Chloroflexota bacterium]|nr:IS630 family transposase [Chloroflexota bacterium]